MAALRKVMSLNGICTPPPIIGLAWSRLLLSTELYIPLSDMMCLIGAGLLNVWAIPVLKAIPKRKHTNIGTLSPSKTRLTNLICLHCISRGPINQYPIQ